MKSKKMVCVLGSGAWGTVIASMLANNGSSVNIYGINESEINEINSKHTNEKYLKKFKINKNVKATQNLFESVKNAEIIVFAVPSFAIKETAKTW